ncbi:MAG: metal ABC transporter ATP-binding protein [Phycisphaerales bacterium JB043]
MRPDEPNSTRPDIHCQGVCFVYPNGTSVLEGVSFDVARGERLGVLGPNGGGKSTLINLILGELQPTSGEITVLGHSPSGARSRGLIGAVPQHARATPSVPLNPSQLVTFAASFKRSSWKPLDPDIRSRVLDTLELVGLSEARELSIDALSHGQHQRLRIAQALVREPRILILDEPDVGIDASGQQQFGELLDRLHRERELTIIIVSHNIRAIASTCDRVLCIARNAHLHSSPEGLTPAVLAEVFQHDMAHALGHSDGDVHVDAHFASDCHGHHDHGSGTEHA